MRLTYLGLLLLLGPSVSSAAEGPASAARTTVLELFTSQGCSSCPPADALLSEIGKRDDLIALAFHVDYWNHLGWRDPFSSRSWSRRQEAYADSLYLGRVYTPQLVVDGRTHLVGSRRAQVEKTLAQSAAEPPSASLRLGLDPSTHRVTITLDIHSDVPGPLDLHLALLESDRDTPVPSGENARRTLHNDYIVRDFKTIATVTDDSTSSTHAFELPPKWRGPTPKSLVAILQHCESRQILAGAKLPLAP